MVERELRSAKRRRIEPSTKVYESGPAPKMQRRFPARHKRVRRGVLDTPERKRQGTLTQQNWLEISTSSQSEEENDEVTERVHNQGSESSESETRRRSAKAKKPPTQRKSKKRAKIADSTEEEEDDEEYGVVKRSRCSKKRKPSGASRSQRTLTQLDDFLIEDTLLSGRVGTPARSTFSGRRKKLGAAKERQRTLTQMVDMPLSDEEEQDPILEGYESEGLCDDPMITDTSPAFKDALRMPDDLKQARRRSNLMTQRTQASQNQENIDPALSSSVRRPLPERPNLIVTPQKQKVRGIPSSQSPVESNISTQRTERFLNSPRHTRIHDIIAETPSKRKNERSVLFAESASGSSRESTQIKDEPTSSQHILSQNANIGEEDTALVHNLDIPSDPPAIPSTDLDFGGNGGPKSYPDSFMVTESEGNGLLARTVTEGHELGTIDLDSPVTPEQEPLDIDKQEHLITSHPHSQRRETRSSQVEVQLQSEFEDYSQRQALESSRKPFPRVQKIETQQKPVRNYPSQATTVDITQATHAHLSTGSLVKSSQRISPTISSPQESPVRPSALLIPSSPTQMPPPRMYFSPLDVRVEEPQFGNDKSQKEELVQDSMGIWSIPMPPPLSSDDEM